MVCFLDSPMVLDGSPVIFFPRPMGGDGDTFFLHATTAAPGATVTINRLTPAGGSITIYWGDGGTTVVAIGDTAAKTHVYAAAATYTISLDHPERVVQLSLGDSKLSDFDTALFAGNVLTYFCVTAIKTSRIASADMVLWTPTSWYLYSMPAGTYNIDSADMALWTPTNWYLSSMPAGTYNIDSADMAGWTPAWWWLYSMPAGTYNINSADMAGWTPAWWWLSSMPAAGSSYTFGAAIMRNWTTARYIYVHNLGLLSAVVDTILADVYAGRMGYTWATPALNVGGTNAAPGGIYQAACPPTTGKEAAFELVNDSCGDGFNKWAVTFTP